MFLHYFTLLRQVNDLQEPLRNATIRASFTQMKNEQILEIESENGKLWHLLLSAHPSYPTLLLREPIRRARNSTDVLSELVGRRIGAVELLPYERVVIMRFVGTQERFYLQFFRNHANFFLLDAQKVIQNAFKKAKKYRGTEYRLKSGNFVDPLQLTGDEFVELIQKGEKAPLEYFLKRRFYFLTPEVLAEIACRTGLNFQQTNTVFAPDELREIHRHINDFFRQCRSDSPRIYFQDRFPQMMTLTHFCSLNALVEERYPAVNEALARFVLLRLRQENLLTRRENIEKHLRRKMAQLEGVISNLKNIPGQKELQERFQRTGELILSQIHRIPTGAEEAVLTDYYHPDQAEIRVKLNPRLSAAENAQVYFRKAKEVGQKQQERFQRLEHLQKQLQELKKIEAELQGEVGFKQLKRIEKQLASLHVVQTAGEKLAESYRPYRTFFRGDWEIWVGKNARANDEMTFRHAHKEDFWLHAQGVAGSHVVVRNPRRLENLPKDVLEYAARLAATNSQARHSSYVPVMVTRVKYVRKPRGATPGAVIPERTKTIFVEPLRNEM